MFRDVFLALALASATSAAAPRGNLQRFTPESAPLGSFAAAPGEILRDGSWAVGLDLDWANNTLVREVTAGREDAIDSQAWVDLRAAYGLFDRLELGFMLPIALFVGGVGEGAGLATSALGDLRIQPRIRLLTQWKDGLALSVSPTLSVPLDGGPALAGAGGVAFLPEVSVSKRLEKLYVGGQLYFHVRPEAKLPGGGKLGHELGLRAAAGYQVGADTQALLELDGGLAFATLANGALGNPLETRLGVRQFLGDSMAIDAAVGAGLLSAPGTPDLRLVVGFTIGDGLRPRPGTSCARDGASEPLERFGVDSDGDGFDDACDVCPGAPESVNGFKDADGCPDELLDGDQDGVPDASDKCPTALGIAPGGCPDTDADGLTDDVDGCPKERGAAPRGCPDVDADGVTDELDRCPAQAEDKDGFQDDDGCVDADDDADGVPDTADRCRLEPEDKDGFEDTDGCPDLDNDQDGVADGQDKCPAEKETINGVDDEDGCPDKGKSLVVMKTEKIEILDKVYFRTGLAEIDERSFKLLKQVALTIRAHVELKRVRVEGHSDDVGDRDTNVELSKRRAEAVLDYLVREGGVAATRLVAEGLGPDRPLAPNTSEDNRAKNRRVEFVIVEEAK